MKRKCGAKTLIVLSLVAWLSGCSNLWEPSEQVTLTVAKTGSGATGGMVISDPSGIYCGTDCSEQYDKGSTITLNATTNGSAIFVKWDGACSGTNPTCVVYMDEDKNVIVEFRDASIPVYTLTVLKNGYGLITSDPPGISCGIDCSESYEENTVVILTASPAAGYIFDGWSGDCTGDSTQCTLTMNSNKTVTATFVEAPPVFFDHFDSDPLSNGWSYGGGNAPGAVVGVSNSFVYASNYGSGTGWYGVEIVADIDTTIDISTSNFELSAYVSGNCSADVTDNAVIDISLLDQYSNRIVSVIWGNNDWICCHPAPDYEGFWYLNFDEGAIWAVNPDGTIMWDQDYPSYAGVISIRKEAGIMKLYANNTEIASTAYSSSTSQNVSKIRVRIYKYEASQPCSVEKVDWVRLKILP